MFFLIATILAVSVTGALIAPLVLIDPKDLIHQEIRFSLAQKQIFDQYQEQENKYKEGSLSLYQWSKEKKQLIEDYYKHS